MPAIPPYTIEPIWQRFAALVTEREVYHPLGCHRPRILDRVVFEKLVQVKALICGKRFKMLKVLTRAWISLPSILIPLSACVLCASSQGKS